MTNIHGLRATPLAAAALALLLGACASIPPYAGKDPRDPLEKINRETYWFNQKLDQYVLKPVARAYVYVVPRALQLCVSNGFDNIGDFRNAANDILQLKPVGAATDTGRLVINSTLGVAGCFDVATRMGLHRRHEDFGLTLARYGIGTGPYLVLPVLGSSDVRDAAGLYPDSYTNPLNWVQVAPVADRYRMYGVYVVDTRASLLQASALVETAALDPYQFTRDAWFQHRRSLQYEGNPPLQPLEEDEGGPGPAPGK